MEFQYTYTLRQFSCPMFISFIIWTPVTCVTNAIWKLMMVIFPLMFSNCLLCLGVRTHYHLPYCICISADISFEDSWNSLHYLKRWSPLHSVGWPSFCTSTPTGIQYSVFDVTSFSEWADLCFVFLIIETRNLTAGF